MLAILVKKLTQAGAELGQAQPKLGWGFTSINLPSLQKIINFLPDILDVGMGEGWECHFYVFTFLYVS